MAEQVFYRLYVDGKLSKSQRIDKPRAIRWLDNSQAMWSKNLMPLVAPGEFDPNNGHEVTRVSETELLVTTTGNRKLHYKIVNCN